MRFSGVRFSDRAADAAEAALREELRRVGIWMGPALVFEPVALPEPKQVNPEERRRLEAAHRPRRKTA